MIPQTWKPWLVLALIFVVGMITGGALTLKLAPHFFRPPGEQQMRNHLMMRLTQRLNLTPDQQAKIQPILADAANQIWSVHRDEGGRISQILEKTNAQIATLLTPEQQTELQAMQKEIRDRAGPGHMHPWGSPHGGPDDMRPPPHGPPDDSMMPPPAPPPNPSPKP